jgi:hypothetical protein
MEKLSRRSKLEHRELLKAIRKLGPGLYDFYHSLEMIQTVQNISRRYKFNEDEEWELFGLVYDVILGMLPLEEVRKELQKRIKLDEDKIGFVAGELDAFIFNHIRPELRKLYGQAPEEEIEESPTPDDQEKKYEADPYREPIE